MFGVVILNDWKENCLVKYDNVVVEVLGLINMRLLVKVGDIRRHRTNRIKY